jgi:hypothetical protein
VKVVARNYVKAIEMSVKMAGHGFTFAGDAIRLCKRLSQDPNPEVGKFIDEMQKIARQAQGDVNDAYNAFSDVRETLLEVYIRILSLLEPFIEGTNRLYGGSKRRLKQGRIPSPPSAPLGEVSVSASVIVRSLNDIYIPFQNVKYSRIRPTTWSYFERRHTT